MRKLSLTLIVSVIFLTAQAQKNYSLTASANFDFFLSGLGINDAGVGFTIQPNLFAKKRLQLRTEISLDHFIGSKELMIDSFGNQYGDNPTMASAKAGPEFNISQNFAVAVLYGSTHFKSFNDKINAGNLKLAVTVHPPKHPKMLIGFQFTKLTGGNSDVHFWGLIIGHRIL